MANRRIVGADNSQGTVLLPNPPVHAAAYLEQLIDLVLVAVHSQCDAYQSVPVRRFDHACIVLDLLRSGSIPCYPAHNKVGLHAMEGT